MNTIEQAREVSARLHLGASIANSRGVDKDFAVLAAEAGNTIDALLAELAALSLDLHTETAAVIALRAELDTIKSQEPVGYAYAHQDYIGSVIGAKGQWAPNEIPLFLAAGAVVKDSLTTQEPTPLEVRLVDTLLGQAQVHTDHPMRHYDRTCPACNAGAQEGTNTTGTPAQEPFAPDWVNYRQGKADGIAEAQERKPMTTTQIKEAFSKPYPKDLPLIELAENNRDFRMDAIGAQHHLTAFNLGVKMAEEFHGIGEQL